MQYVLWPRADRSNYRLKPKLCSQRLNISCNTFALSGTASKVSFQLVVSGAGLGHPTALNVSTSTCQRRACAASTLPEPNMEWSWGCPRVPRSEAQHADPKGHVTCRNRSRHTLPTIPVYMHSCSVSVATPFFRIQAAACLASSVIEPCGIKPQLASRVFLGFRDGFRVWLQGLGALGPSPKLYILYMNHRPSSLYIRTSMYSCIYIYIYIWASAYCGSP